MMQNYTHTAALNRFQRIALIVGIIGLVLMLIGAFTGLELFFQSYLFAFLFWLGLSLGSLVLLFIHYAAGGPWGVMVRRPLEAATMVLPVLALLFIPLLFGLGELYEWTHADVVQETPLLQAKAGYLNIPFFTIRAAIYFIIWIGGAIIYYRYSQRQDKDYNPGVAQRMRRWSAPGIILYIMTMTFAAFDWGMSLEPEWFSGIYGVLFMIGQAISAVALMILIIVIYGNRKPLSDIVNPTRVQDLGNFLMAFAMFWAYVQASQLIILWSNNVVETNTWYVLRFNNQWVGLGTFVYVFHFFVPFLILFSRWVKRKIRALTWIAIWMLFMRLVDLFWTIIPPFAREGFPLKWLDVVAVIGLGGIWLAVFAYYLKSSPLLPVNDPLSQTAPSTHGAEAVSHG